MNVSGHTQWLGIEREKGKNWLSIDIHLCFLTSCNMTSCLPFPTIMDDIPFKPTARKSRFFLGLHLMRYLVTETRKVTSTLPQRTQTSERWEICMELLTTFVKTDFLEFGSGHPAELTEERYSVSFHLFS